MPTGHSRYPLRPPPPDPEKTIFLTHPSTNFGPSYKELFHLVPHHAQTIATRWRKKSIALRSKCLTRAWAAASSGKKIPERRPRLSEKLLLDPETSNRDNPLLALSMEEFLFAPINIEQLAPNAANLLNLIYSRTSKHPSEFGRSDYFNFVKPVLKLFRLVDDHTDDDDNDPAQGTRRRRNRRKGVDVVVIKADESEYGTIKSWNRQTEDYGRSIAGMLVCNVEPEGEWLMKWQKTIVDFCLHCVKDILGPDAQKTPENAQPLFGAAEKLLEAVPNLSIPNSTDSRSASLLLRPYTIPEEFKWKDAHKRALTELRAAEDRLNLLRSDPSYLLSQVELRLAFRAEHIEDLYGRKGNPESSESVGDALKKLIHNSYTAVVVWNEIVMLFEDAEQLSAGKTSLGSAALDEKIMCIDALLGLCEDFSLNAIKLHAPAGPQLRHRFLRVITESFTGQMALTLRDGINCSTIFAEDPVAGLIVCLNADKPAWESEIFTLERVSDELEHLLTEKPELKRMIHPWIMNVLSNLAVVYDLKENLQRHVPSGEQITGEVAFLMVGLAPIINDFAQLWPEVDLSPFLGKDQYGWQRLQKIAEDSKGGKSGLERFWELADKEVVKLSHGKTLDGWICSHKGRLAKKRKGRWQWQGNVWFAEGAAVEDIPEDVGENDDLPELVPIPGFDDAEGYGDEQNLVIDGNIPPRGPLSGSNGSRGRLNQKPPGPAKPAEKVSRDRKPVRPATLTTESTLPDLPFGVSADGSRGVEPEPVPPPKIKKKTRPEGKEDASTQPDSSHIEHSKEEKHDEQQPLIFVTKRVFSALNMLSKGIPLAWKEFMHLMTNVGFAAHPVGGSVTRFVPECEEDEPINIHRPHPESTLGKFECLWIWKRLKRSYGWSMNNFREDSKSKKEGADNN